MDMQDFFAGIPRGKEDAPLLFSWGNIIYDHHDIDGLYTMLDQEFSGCVILNFSKPMNPDIVGRAEIDGIEVRHLRLKFMPVMGNMWVLAVRVRGIVNEYGKNYTLHVEGFRDTDNLEMKPQDLIIHCKEKTEPQEKYAAHEAVALQTAEEGIVLLKNTNNLLPLKEQKIWNIFGKGIYQFRVGAVGAGKINPRYIVDLLEAIRTDENYEVNEELADFYRCDEDWIPEDAILERARKKSDTAIMLLTRGSGENQDNSSGKGNYYLTDDERVLLNKITEMFTHVVVVLNTAYPIDMTFAEQEKIESVVYLGLAGMLAGEALFHILSGTVNPSGKLTDTWAKDYFDIPSSRNFYDCADKPRLDSDCGIFVDTCYEEGMYVGYRYFTTFGKENVYPFGYGLSYTDFSIETGKVEYKKCTGVRFPVTVRNTGNLSGKQVVQIYLGQPEEGLETPERILVGFEKTKLLEPGESQQFEIDIKEKYMTSYDEKKAAYVLEKGLYRVFAGTDVNAPECGAFEVKETSVVKQVTNLMKPNRELCYLSKLSPEQTFPKGKDSGVKEGVTEFTPRSVRKNYPSNFHGKAPEKKLTYEDIKKNPDLAESFVAQLSLEELARIAVCGADGWGMEGIGEAGRIVKLERYAMPDFPVADGNSGVNLNQPNIGMPSSIMLCSSFNKELAEDVGRVIGEEAKELGIPMILAPAFNLHRNPLNGRHPEYFSEDPYLAGMMAGHYARGMEQAGTASCMKHLLANNCESSRKRNMSILSERVLRELYFRVFEIAMDVQMPAAFMTAYNACNGCPTAADSELLLGMLREENGFDGFIMTDWGTYDSVEIPDMVQAGNCWITPGSLDETYTEQIVKGVQNGKIELDRLRENITWMIRTMSRYV